MRPGSGAGKCTRALSHGNAARYILFVKVCAERELRAKRARRTLFNVEYIDEQKHQLSMVEYT